MRLLIVEDDDNKRQALEQFLLERDETLVLAFARSYNAALKKLSETEVDLVLLDMTLPSFDVTSTDPGGKLQPFAGKEILRQMARRRSKARAVVVTQYDRFGEGAGAQSLPDLNEELRSVHGERYLGAVYYSTLTGDWRRQLGRIMQGFEREVAENE